MKTEKDLKNYLRGVTIEDQGSYVHVKTCPSGVYVSVSQIDEIIKELQEIREKSLTR